MEATKKPMTLEQMMTEEQRKMANVRQEIAKIFTIYEGFVKEDLGVTTREAQVILEEGRQTTKGSESNEVIKREMNRLEEKINVMEDIKKNVEDCMKSLKLRNRSSSDLQSQGSASKGKVTVALEYELKFKDRDMDTKLENILEHASIKCKLEEFNGLSKQLQMCLLCFSIFPMDAEIVKRFLIYWWIGEGFVTAKAGKTAEEVGEDHFTELVDGDFIQPIYNRRRGNILRCRMHPWIRWMIIMLSRKEEFFNLDESGMPSSSPSKSRHACIMTKNKDGQLDKEYWPESETETPKETSKAPKKKEPKKKKTKETETSKETSKAPKEKETKETETSKETSKAPKKKEPKEKETKETETSKETSKAPKKKEPKEKETKETETPKENEPNLLTLFNVNVRYLKFKHGVEFLPKLKTLVVLQLGSWRGSSHDHMDVDDPKKQDDPGHHIEIEEPEILDRLGALVHLRYLSLRGISRITKLPKSIRALRNLEILDLKGCQNLEKLTEEIKCLEKLTHLDVSDCYMLECMPKGLSSLKELQVLKGFVFGGHRSRNPCKLADLERLKKLKKLSISIGKQVNERDVDLHELFKIKGLRSVAITWTSDDINGGKFTSLSFPTELVKLDLRCFLDSNLPTSWFNPKHLPNLEKLYIRGGKLKKLHLAEKWTKIKMMRLKFLKELVLETVNIVESLPQLEYLEVYKCPKNNLSDESYQLDSDGVWVKEALDMSTAAAPASAATTTTLEVPPASTAPTTTPEAPPASTAPTTTPEASTASAARATTSKALPTSTAPTTTPEASTASAAPTTTSKATPASTDPTTTPEASPASPAPTTTPEATPASAAPTTIPESSPASAAPTTTSEAPPASAAPTTTSEAPPASAAPTTTPEASPPSAAPTTTPKAPPASAAPTITPEAPPSSAAPTTTQAPPASAAPTAT